MKIILPYIFIIVLLSGCTQSPHKFVNYKGNLIGISTDDMTYMQENNYSEQERTEFIKFIGSDNAVTRNKCGPNHPNEYGEIFGSYKCDSGTIIAYEDFLRHQAQERKEYETRINNRRQDIMQKVEKSGCRNYFAFKFPYKVLQQISEGTLITVADGFSYYAYQANAHNIYLIIKNSVDSGRVDNERIQDGFFEEIGTFQYVNALGTTSTIKKLKRCTTESF